PGNRSRSLDIEGPGASLLAISGNDANRVFNVNERLTVTIAGLTITHGRAPQASGGNGEGGGGGGILNAGSTLTVANDLFSYNDAEARGGGISNHVGSVLTVTNSTFVGNRAISNDPVVFAEGGAIWNDFHGCA